MLAALPPHGASFMVARIYGSYFLSYFLHISTPPLRERYLLGNEKGKLAQQSMRNSALVWMWKARFCLLSTIPGPFARTSLLSKCCPCYLCPASHLIFHVSDTVWTPMQSLLPDICFVTHMSLQNSISLMILIKAHLLPMLPSEALGDTADATGHDCEHKRVLCLLIS